MGEEVLNVQGQFTVVPNGNPGEFVVTFNNPYPSGTGVSVVTSDSSSDPAQVMNISETGFTVNGGSAALTTVCFIAVAIP